MPREFSRAHRIADAIKRLLARFIQQDVRDPRVSLVNINDVIVNRDLSIAKVYFTFVGRDGDHYCREGEAALNKAAGFLRNLLAKELCTRTIPKLQFFYDDMPVSGQRLSGLIQRAVSEDRARQGNG